MLKIGLTGGIGSGKTTVSDLFAKRAVHVIDADITAHQICEPGQAGYHAMIDLFGPSILDEALRINRVTVRSKVFDNTQLKEALETRLHPLIFASMDKQMAAIRAPYCILSIPLLIETGSQSLVDRVLVVDSEESMQIARVRQRDGNSEDLIKAIMNAQISREIRLKQADDVIINKSSLIDLDKQVEKLHNFYLSLSN